MSLLRLVCLLIGVLGIVAQPELQGQLSPSIVPCPYGTDAATGACVVSAPTISSPPLRSSQPTRVSSGSAVPTRSSISTPTSTTTSGAFRRCWVTSTAGGGVTTGGTPSVLQSTQVIDGADLCVHIRYLINDGVIYDQYGGMSNTNYQASQQNPSILSLHSCRTDYCNAPGFWVSPVPTSLASWRPGMTVSASPSQSMIPGKPSMSAQPIPSSSSTRSATATSTRSSKSTWTAMSTRTGTQTSISSQSAISTATATATASSKSTWSSLSSPTSRVYLSPSTSPRTPSMSPSTSALAPSTNTPLPSASSLSPSSSAVALSESSSPSTSALAPSASAPAPSVSAIAVSESPTPSTSAPVPSVTAVATSTYIPSMSESMSASTSPSPSASMKFVDLHPNTSFSDSPSASASTSATTSPSVSSSASATASYQALRGDGIDRISAQTQTPGPESGGPSAIVIGGGVAALAVGLVGAVVGVAVYRRRFKRPTGKAVVKINPLRAVQIANSFNDVKAPSQPMPRPLKRDASKKLFQPVLSSRLSTDEEVARAASQLFQENYERASFAPTPSWRGKSFSM